MRIFFLLLCLGIINGAFSQKELFNSIRGKDQIVISDTMDVKNFNCIAENYYKILQVKDTAESLCFCSKHIDYIKNNLDKIINENENKLDSFTIPEIINLVRIWQTIYVNKYVVNKPLLQQLSELLKTVYLKKIITKLKASPVAAGSWYSNQYNIGLGGLVLTNEIVLKDKD